MSRANPIALRIASKTQSSMFIGISQYYFDDQLKQNINMFKLTELLSKQTVLPTNKLVKHNVVNSDNVTVLTPNVLPINIVCAAKQLFSTKFTLNKRRFCSAILHYVHWLQDDFNNNYKRFNLCFGRLPSQSKGKSSSNASLRSIKPYKLPNQIINITNASNTREKYAKKNHFQFCGITKANQINRIHKYFVFNRLKTKYTNILLDTNIKFMNSLMHLSSLGFKRGAEQKKTANIYTQTNTTKPIDGKLLNIQNFKKMPYYLAAKSGAPITPLLSLQKVDQLCYFKPNYEHMTYSMFLLSFLSVLYLQHKQENQVSAPITGISLSNQLQIGKKNPLSTDNVTKLKQNLANPASNSRLSKCRYIVSPYSGLKKSNGSTFSKVQKHINLFRNTVKPATSLELVIYRSFCEPAGLNYISALENRLSKSRCSAKMSNILFRRPFKSNFVPNYTNAQTGFIRLKGQIIFEFLYTISYRGELDVEQKSWLRKESSIRL
uniref:Uncharacterized protein n=1 Tax=Ulva expansa TaxID=2293988 RepID=A0A3G2WB74_9CHLO|nr:hypothetical protein [Ulva expansa]AYO97747.1 hypothetical protein [Ulva expansa]AYP41025.1 hypothetical protein [Ulva expansa]